ncbi:hypothetical protein [Hydrogenophaga sp.]|uniref:DUF1016 N-terminal domain-containing protein n=1 Tax=Hydrogenophaga sp. TaxID=1904254 RepID=UPI003459689E
MARRFGQGFSERDLEQMRLFYMAWPPKEISQTPSAILEASQVEQATGESTSAPISESLHRKSGALHALTQVFPQPWSAYVRLLSVRAPPAHSFYETEALSDG